MMSRFANLLPLIFVLVALSSCGDRGVDNREETTDTAMFRLLHPDSTGVAFNNHIEENDIFNMVDFFYVYNGGGVAIGDINNDGLPDIHFTGNMVEDRLYLNKGGLRFEDISESAGIIVPGWSTGTTMVDIDQDGLLDIYVCRSGNVAPDKRKNLLFINQGNERFVERAEAYGLADPGYSTQAVFFDYDKDGDLDMYLLNHTNEIRNPNNVRPLIKDGSGPANDRLYRNDGNKGSGMIFTDVTKGAGILFDGFGLGVAVADLNGDGWEDIFVTNDFIANDYVYINKKDGTFEEMSKTYLDHASHFSMGNDIADFNNDGLPDIVTLDMRPRDNYHEKKMTGPLNFDLFDRMLGQGYMPQYMRNTLQLNNGISDKGRPSFSEIGQLAGIDATDWSWAPLFADFDNDGLKDLFITNGYLRDITDLDFINYTGSLSGNVSSDSLDIVLKEKAKEMPSLKLPNFFFRNLGNLKFGNVSEQWGGLAPSLSNGAAYADLDNDGDLDIVVNNINETAYIYENKSDVDGKHGYLTVNLIGDSLNTRALGTQIRLFQEGRQQSVQKSVTRGYLSSVDDRIHFGLGTHRTIDSLVVTWPDGRINKVLGPKPDQILTIAKNDGSMPLGEDREIPINRVFKEITAASDLEFDHGDEVYYDFNRQFLLPHKHSNQGPGLAVADINGDGMEDFFMGGGYNHSGQFFYGTSSGKFERRPLIKNEKEKYEEDTGVLFFDYDGDGDQDLYVVSGSNEFYESSEYYQDRLYNNDGNGNFTLDTLALPLIKASGSCVRAADFDQDGDLDLFVGGRLTPLKYPIPPSSYLLINEGGKFRNAILDLAPSLGKVGMVTDAIWTDYDTDGDLDLIVVGEFMAIQFYENQGGKFVNSTEKTGLAHTSGWWNSINGGDFDNDGDIDYIVGNLGLNTRHKVSPTEPLTVYAQDYDKNGSMDPIMSTYKNGVEYPVHSRDDLIRQVPSMKKKFPDYTTYANAALSDVISKNDQSSSFIAKAFQFATVYLQNNGNGSFELNILPDQAQMAPVYGILIEDWDRDGNLDVLLSGNDFGSEIGAGRYDASKGTLLKGNGDGAFLSVPVKDSGLLVDGDSRGAVAIRIGDRLGYMFGRNSNSLKAYMVDAPVDQDSLVTIPQDVVKAKIGYKDGRQRIHEFYYGSSYLSQSTRTLTLNGNEVKIVLYDYSGKEKIVQDLK